MAGRVNVSIEVRGARALERALRVLGETDAPYLREALEESGRMLDRAVSRRGVGGIGAATAFTRVTGRGGRLKATVVVRHPGAKAMEFGRKTYYRGFTDRRQKATGTAFRAAAGQRARPFVGIRAGNAAIAEVEGPIRELLLTAGLREWERIGAEGDR